MIAFTYMKIGFQKVLYPIKLHSGFNVSISVPFFGKSLFTYSIRHSLSVCITYLTVVLIYAVNAVLQKKQLHRTLWDFLEEKLLRCVNVSYV